MAMSFEPGELENWQKNVNVVSVTSAPPTAEGNGEGGSAPPASLALVNCTLLSSESKAFG